MPGPLQAAGATAEPSEYAPLTMDRYITGLWTQRSPLRDADVPYLYTKFYSASRFDSLIDGINREVTARLTIARRCGLSVYNDNVFPPINSFYPFKVPQNNGQNIRVMADTANTVYDATAGFQTVIFNKSAGAGKTRFQGIGPSLYMTDGQDLKQWINQGPWPGAAQDVQPGTLITDFNNNLQMAVGGVTLNIVSSQSNGTVVMLNADTTSLPDNFANLEGALITFSGLTVATFLNGHTLQIFGIGGSTLGELSVIFTSTAFPTTADTGSGTTGNGTTGGSAPAFSTVKYTVVADAGQQWKCYGSAVQNWGVKAPLTAPTVTPGNATRFWQPNTVLSSLYAVLDPTGNIQVAFNTTAGSGGVFKTGSSYPKWKTGLVFPFFNQTVDGTISWLNAGQIGTWTGLTVFLSFSVILDSNQNLQYVTNGGGGMSGSVEPTGWATVVGNQTTDGGLTWTCLGPGVEIFTESVQYAFSGHSIDGSVTTASPVATIQGGVLGPPTSSTLYSGYVNVDGAVPGVPPFLDTQYDQIWVWRTAQGGSTLLLLDQIPIDNINPNFLYVDLGIPDTSTLGGPSLNAFIAAPIDSQNNPPTKNSVAPAYHMSRLWMIQNGNIVVFSGGPDVIVGNGNTAFPPLNFFLFPELITRLIPITVNNGGLIVVGTANTYIILGTGTSSNPFFASLYMASVGVLNYDAIDIVGSTIYAFTNNSKFISLDPSAGYVECGFPIGDQFLNVTNGNANGGGTVGALYNPQTAFVAWNERTSGDSGIYVSDGAIGWFRYSPVASPESGFLWSPRAQIQGGTSAVQNCEVTTGNQRLLVGPHTSGPILMRDESVFQDNGVSYQDSYVTIGSIILCESGEVAEVAHVALKSMRVGDRPVVKMLFGEIAATDKVPFEEYEWTCPDPPDLPESQTLFNDRYVMMDGSGVCPKCDHVQVMIEWPVQAVGDELLTHSIYGAKWAERKQQ